MYVIVWSFLPQLGREAEFERRYGAAGDWVTLFQEAPGYLGTDLFQEVDGSRRYLVVDRWQSGSAYEAFRVARCSEYKTLDDSCKALTISEERVGNYVRIEPMPNTSSVGGSSVPET